MGNWVFTGTEDRGFPQESLLPISMVIPEYADWIKTRWDKNDFVDFGGGTVDLPYERVYVKGKDLFAEFMKPQKLKQEVIDEMWNRLEEAAKQEPFQTA